MRRVGGFQALAAKKSGTASGRALGQFAGTIAKEDLALMAEAIEAACEHVTLDQCAGVDPQKSGAGWRMR